MGIVYPIMTMTLMNKTPESGSLDEGLDLDL